MKGGKKQTEKKTTEKLEVYIVRWHFSGLKMEFQQMFDSE